MAQLVWRPVEAQQGSTRDIALAGANITNSFDRMGQMLKDREASLRTEATDKARVGYLRETDPEKLAAMIATYGQGGGLDPRANLADVLSGAQAHRSGLIDSGLKNEELLTLRDDVAQSADVTRLYQVLADEKATGEQRQQAYLGISDARNAARFTETGSGIWDATRGRVQTGARDAETVLSNRADEANQGARLRLDQSRYTRDLERDAGLEQAHATGRSFMDTQISEGVDPQSALKNLYESDAYLSAPSWAQQQMRASASNYAGLERGLAPDERTGAGRKVSGFARILEQRIPQANQAREDQTRAANPMMDIALKGEEYGNLPISEVGDFLNNHLAVGHLSDAYIHNLLERNPGLTSGHIKAIVERTGNRLTIPGLKYEMQNYLKGTTDANGDPLTLSDYVSNNGAGAARLQINRANEGRVGSLAKVRQLEELARAADERGDESGAKSLAEEARLLYMKHFDPDGFKDMQAAGRVK